MLGIIGHASIDIIIKNGGQYRSPGGPPTYCSFYLSQVSINVFPISVIGNDFKGYIREYIDRGIDVNGITLDETCRTTSYEITYIDGGRRRLRLLARCRDITVSDIKALPRVAVVNPIAREISYNTLMYVREHADFMGVDVQGFTRNFTEGGLVVNKATTDDLIPIINIADVIKMSIDDVNQLSINELMRFRDKFIVVSKGPDGSMLIHDGKIYNLSVNGLVNAVDPTGAGDVLTCTLTHLLGKGDDMIWSFAYANALSLAKTLGEGPYGILSKELINELVEVLLSRTVPT